MKIAPALRRPKNIPDAIDDVIELEKSGPTDARNVIGLQMVKQNVAGDGFHEVFLLHSPRVLQAVVSNVIWSF